MVVVLLWPGSRFAPASRVFISCCAVGFAYVLGVARRSNSWIAAHSRYLRPFTRIGGGNPNPGRRSHLRSDLMWMPKYLATSASEAYPEALIWSLTAVSLLRATVHKETSRPQRSG